MDCVNHSGVGAAAYCQNCGKALCSACVRTAAGGQVLCEPCWTAWQGVPNPYVAPPPPGSPSPIVAGLLGLIPGVGAMYNGQFFKGLIHVVIFAILISMASHHGVFGIFIAAWIFYQAFEAYHTAKARRDGQSLPDPLGLNEVGNWLNLGGKVDDRPDHPGAGPVPGPISGANPGAGPSSQGSASQAVPPSNYPPYQGASGDPYQTGYQPRPYSGPYQGPGQAPYQNPYQGGPYQNPYPGGPYTGAGVPPAAGFTQPGAPPVPPVHWRRKEPVGAIILIFLGVLFLLGQWDLLSGRVFEFSWPVLLIGLGVWLVVRRLQDAQPSAPPRAQDDLHQDTQGGSK